MIIIDIFFNLLGIIATLFFIIGGLRLLQLAPGVLFKNKTFGSGRNAYTGVGAKLLLVAGIISCIICAFILATVEIENIKLVIERRRSGRSFLEPKAIGDHVKDTVSARTIPKITSGDVLSLVMLIATILGIFVWVATLKYSIPMIVKGKVFLIKNYGIKLSGNKSRIAGLLWNIAWLSAIAFMISYGRSHYMAMQ